MVSKQIPSNCVAAFSWCIVCHNNTMHDVSQRNIVKNSCWICREKKQPSHFGSTVYSELDVVEKICHDITRNISRITKYTNEAKDLDSVCVFADMVFRQIEEEIPPQLRKETKRMLPSGSGAATTSKKDGVPTLTIEQLSTSPKNVRILGIRSVEGRFGRQIKVKVAVDGTMYFWYLALTSPQWQSLKAKFGLDENNYVNVNISLQLERDEFEERYNILVDFPDGEVRVAKRR